MAEESTDVPVKAERRIVQGSPAIQDIRGLAVKTQSEQIEYGVSVYQTFSGKTESVYVSGGSGSIYEPELGNQYRA